MIDELKIKYKVENDIDVRLFGQVFVENNSDKCKIKINGAVQNLTEFFHYFNPQKPVKEVEEEEHEDEEIEKEDFEII